MRDLPSSDLVLYALSLVALAAQAMTAALAAGSAAWIGSVSACLAASPRSAGGSIRDVLLGHYPLIWVQSPVYLALTAGSAFVTILIARVVHRLHLAFLVLDAIGLVVFTMAGCDVAWQMNDSLPIVIVSGMITGCAGGRAARHSLQRRAAVVSLRALRQRLGRDRLVLRYGLRSEIERCDLDRADLLWSVLSFRLLAIRYKWEMPKFVFNDDRR